MRVGGGGLIPRRPGRKSGVHPFRILSVAILLATVLGVPGCTGGEETEPPPPDPWRDIRERLSISERREIHRVTLDAADGAERVVPSMLRVGLDAVVVFEVVDGRVHTVLFPEDSLPLDGALFLRRTDQLESPPLMSRGSRFVVTFEDAPLGRYLFVSHGPNGDGWGSVVVEDAP